MKKCLIYGMIGGMMTLGYIKYKDGTLKRTIRNMKPMIESVLNN